MRASFLAGAIASASSCSRFLGGSDGVAVRLRGLAERLGDDLRKVCHNNLRCAGPGLYEIAGGRIERHLHDYQGRLDQPQLVGWRTHFGVRGGPIRGASERQLNGATRKFLAASTTQGVEQRRRVNELQSARAPGT